jgi:hypothetical protein
MPALYYISVMINLFFRFSSIWNSLLAGIDERLLYYQLFLKKKDGGYLTAPFANNVNQ